MSIIEGISIFDSLNDEGVSRLKIRIILLS